MKSKYSIVILILFAFTVSFCTQKNKEADVATLNSGVKAEVSKPKSKCCASNIPPRFPIKNPNIPQPAGEN